MEKQHKISKQQKRNKIVFLITGIIVIISLCIGLTKKEFENDTFYTIKVGESIIKNGIDYVDHFSWHELDYMYPHWLYDIGIYEIYNIFGFDGIYVSTMILYTILELLVFLVSYKKSKSLFVSLLTTVLTTILCGAYATARAQLVSYILFVLELYFIERLLESKKIRYGIFLLVICLLIANIHAAVWPLYFILFLPYICENIVYLIKNKIHTKKSSKVFLDKLVISKDRGFKLLLIVMVISLFMGLITPIKDMPYTYAIKIMMGDTQEYIFEHASLVLVENPFVIVYLVAFFFVSIFTKVKIKLSDICLICGLTIMAFISVRHVALLLILGIIPLARMITDVLNLRLGDYNFDLYINWIGSLVIMVAVILCSKFTYDNTSNKDYINVNLYPVYALEFMEKNYDMDEVKLYNEYDFGSYLLFKDIPVYIDSRSDLYTKAFNKEYDIFDECMNISDNYGTTFNKYKITHVMTYSTTELAKILTVSDNFKQVYSDGAFKIFEVLSNYNSEEEK